MNLQLKLDAKTVLDNIEKVRSKGLKQILNFGIGKTSSYLASYIILRHLTGGTTQDRLKTRSGLLKQTTIPLVPKSISEYKVEGGVQFGTKYAPVHISDKPKTTIITPKTAKALAIPIPGSPATTAAGVTRHTGSIRQAYPFLSYIKGKNSIILADTRGGNFIPYFILKKSVKISSRVHLDEILNTKKTDIENIFKQAIDEYIKI
jgi:hypothetical protein